MIQLNAAELLLTAAQGRQDRQTHPAEEEASARGRAARVFFLVAAAAARAVTRGAGNADRVRAVHLAGAGRAELLLLLAIDAVVGDRALAEQLSVQVVLPESPPGVVEPLPSKRVWQTSLLYCAST